VPPTVLRNLGVAYQFRSRTHPGALEAMVRHWRRYIALDPTTDPDLPSIKTLVEEAERTLATRPATKP
jgi:hypothetical protein